MQWILRDGSRQLTISTGRGAPFAGAVRVDDPGAAASLLRNLAFDPANLKTLRRIYAELVDGHTARSRVDTLIIAEIMGLLTSSRLYLFDRERPMGGLDFDPVEPEDAEPWDDAEVLAAEPAPEPQPAPAPSVAVIAQAAALREAATTGAPFCEE
ncbi:MAG: hypothetical protein AB1Z98_36655 [Nannocystaceae bacterium]